MIFEILAVLSGYGFFLGILLYEFVSKMKDMSFRGH